MRKNAWKYLLWVALILAPGVAHAQSSIAGVVKDTSGAVLPGVTVEAGSDVLIERFGRLSPTATGCIASSICARAPTR